MFAFAVEKASGFDSAIASWIGSGGLSARWKENFVVTRDNCGHIQHIAMADFSIIFIAYFVKSMMFREMLCD